MRTLSKQENKNGTFTYTVKDSQGNVITKRTSKRGNYIACSPEGNFYFSRVELIGKGDSKDYFDKNPELKEKIAYLSE